MIPFILFDSISQLCFFFTFMFCYPENFLILVMHRLATSLMRAGLVRLARAHVRYMLHNNVS